MSDKEKVKEFIRKKYADIALKDSQGCGCGSDAGCCGGTLINLEKVSLDLGYSKDELGKVPPGANMGLGCGNPIAVAGLKEGETVLDLGSGGGFDCFLAREQVGETGYVIGVDMTPEMVKMARKNAEKSGYKNVEFRLGEIEHLPIADASVDVIISNCVINLSPEKEKVFREMYRVLKPGGRLSISDIVATAKLPDNIKQDLAMIAACIGGAEFVEDIKKMLADAGFINIRLTPLENSRQILQAWAPGTKLEEYVASYIIEASKG